MKKKILTVITSVICALSIVAAFAVKSPVAKAEVDKENYVLNSFDDSFVSNNCEVSKYAKTYTALTNQGAEFKKYNGYHVRFNGVGSYVEYKKTIDVTDNTANDIIFEFIPSVETQGTREFYKFCVYFIDEQSEDKYIKLEFKANGDYYTYVNASAKDGENELKPASKYQGVYKSDNGFQTGFGIGGYGSAQKFQSFRIYWDNTKKTMEVGASRESNNVVRDFSISDGELGIDGYTGTDVFSGFDGNVKIKVAVENNLTADYANMTFISIDGEKFARPFGLEKENETVEVGETVTLPEITEAWDVTNAKSLEASDLTPEIEVKDPLGNAVALSDKTFTADKKGPYTARYFVEQNGTTYCSEYKVNAIERKNNSFDDSFVANNCETSKYAKTYTALTNQGAEFKKYNGYNAKFNDVGSYVEYKKSVDVTDNTTNDVIFEFIPAVETPGSGKKEFYKFSVYFIDEQSEDKYIKLEFKANGDYYTYVNASAKDGENEIKPASKYQGVYKSDNGFQVGFGLGGLGGTQNFQSFKIYWDNTKKTMEVGSSRESGNFVVRDFKKSDSELGIDGYTGTEAFGGFTSGKVKIKVAVENNLTANQANMTFISVDGESFARPFGMEEIDGNVLTGDEVALPAVNNGWNVASGKEATISESDYTASVTCDGEIVAVENGKFIPKKGGEYTIVYKCTQDGVPYKVEQTITVTDVNSGYALPGAAIRVNTADGKNGIRFYARVEKQLYDELSGREGFASGTLVIPQSNLGDSSLDVNTETVLNIATTEKWYQSGEYMVSVVYLYDIPAANYGEDICARGYITADGKTYYTETGKWSMTYVAEYAYKNFDISKDKLSEYFGTVHTVTYKTADGTEIKTENVKFADTAAELPTEFDGKKIIGYKLIQGEKEVDFDPATEILEDTTIIVVFEE